MVPYLQRSGVGALYASPVLLLPGERIGQDALDYLVSGVKAGMVLPDPADPELGTVRVVA
jgi:arginine/lysine/ornithine decarboxylase